MTITYEEIERGLRPVRPHLMQAATELIEDGHEDAAAIVGCIATNEDAPDVAGAYWSLLKVAPEEERWLAFWALYQVAKAVRDERPAATARLVNMIEAGGEAYGLPGEGDQAA